MQGAGGGADTSRDGPAVTVVADVVYARKLGMALKGSSDGWRRASAMPTVAVLGILSLLVATLSTVGIFLRLRTASLSEIQLRLAALEEMIVSHLDLHDD